MKVACIIPVHDEAAILDEHMERVWAWGQQAFGPHFMLVISENGSTDASPELARQLERRLPGCVAVISKEPGKGGAIKRAAAVEADAYLLLDADLSTDLASACAVVEAVASGIDAAIGSRRLPESRVRRPWSRKLVTIIYAAVSHAVLGLGVRDPQCGCKAFSRSVRDDVLGDVRDDGFFFDTEFLALLRKRGRSIKEIGIEWTERSAEAGKSKVRLFKDGWEFLRKMIVLRRIL